MSLLSEPELANSTRALGIGDQRASACHQIGHRPRHLAGERVVVRQRLHLPRGGIGQPRFAEAERRAPQAGHALDVALAVLVDHVHAIAAHDDQRPFALELAQLGVRMQVVRDVALGGGREGRRHAGFRWVERHYRVGLGVTMAAFQPAVAKRR